MATLSGCWTEPRPACCLTAEAGSPVRGFGQMPRFIARHVTAILVTLVVAWWAIFYLPQTPTWAILWLRNAVQNRDGDAAVRYIDFQSVVQHAAKDMVEQNAGNNPLGSFVGKAAVQLLAGPLAQVAESWAKQKVNEGDHNLQIPADAVAEEL